MLAAKHTAQKGEVTVEIGSKEGKVTIKVSYIKDEEERVLEEKLEAEE